MYLVREVMHCKPGMVRPLVEIFKQMSKVMKDMGYHSSMRILTDVSGERYWTAVSEMEVASLEEYTDMSRKGMTDKRFQKVMKNYHKLVESGHREIYRIEQ